MYVSWHDEEAGCVSVATQRDYLFSFLAVVVAGSEVGRMLLLLLSLFRCDSLGDENGKG